MPVETTAGNNLIPLDLILEAIVGVSPHDVLLQETAGVGLFLHAPLKEATAPSSRNIRLLLAIANVCSATACSYRVNSSN